MRYIHTHTRGHMSRTDANTVSSAVQTASLISLRIYETQTWTTRHAQYYLLFRVAMVTTSDVCTCPITEPRVYLYLSPYTQSSFSLCGGRWGFIHTVNLF